MIYNAKGFVKDIISFLYYKKRLLSCKFGPGIMQTASCRLTSGQRSARESLS